MANLENKDENLIEEENEENLNQVEENLNQVNEDLEKDSSDEKVEVETEIEEDKQDSDEENEKYAALEDNFVRLQADFVNYKRRTEQERKDYIELGSRKVLNELLTVIDNFERAIEAHTNEESFKEGVELIYKQLLELLNKNNVTEMKCLNEKFDPEFHHAVLVEEKQGVEEGIIIDVLQKGYLIGEKVLRPAMVKVSQ